MVTNQDEEIVRVKSSIHAAVVTPQVAPQMPYGIVPFDGMPAYSHFYRWDREKLGPLPGVPTSSISDQWSINEWPEEIYSEKSWYGGVIDSHFGHFITETITRSWWHLQNYPHDRTAVYVPRTKGLKSWQRDIFSYLDIDKINLIRRPVHFNNLLIPEQGALLFSTVHDPGYQDLLANWNLHKQGPRKIAKKIFLGRPGGDSFGLIGQALLAECFQEAGYEIFYPEQHPIQEQLEVIRSASHVVGVQGSAFHIFNLLGRSPDTKVLIFQRLGNYSSSKFMQTIDPYIGQLDIVPTAIRFVSPRGSNYDSSVLSLEELAEKVGNFDSGVDVSKYINDRFLEDLIRHLGGVADQVDFQIREDR